MKQVGIDAGDNFVKRISILCVALIGVGLMTNSGLAQDATFDLRFQSRRQILDESTKSERTVLEEVERSWLPKQTAFIVCDVWDAHHFLNAVRRLEEFAPRMNEVLKEARKRGATIIHSPSDCMAAYENHAARKRAVAAPAAKNKPKDIEHWCSRIPSEEQAVYPIDQSGEDEHAGPREHTQWVAKLKEMGRNPGMPWKTQSELIEIDADRDFISDRGDEVWNILEQREIKNVILVGVHLNMCVLGRPFGLRQMVRNGKRVALMRDMTDCMYNPQCWPYVDHFTGNDLMISHVERYVCPTITSDQFLGGEVFRSKFDKRPQADLLPAESLGKRDRATFETQWSLISVPSDWKTATDGAITEFMGVVWYRCTVRVPSDWAGEKELSLSMPSSRQGRVSVWLNSYKQDKSSVTASRTEIRIDPRRLLLDDVNWLVVRLDSPNAPNLGFSVAPELRSTKGAFVLKGRWQFRLEVDAGRNWSYIRIPAKFGGSTDMLFEPK